MVTTSNHVLVNMADFGDDLEIEGDVLAAKRSHEDDDTSGGESDGSSGTSVESDADVVLEERRRRGAYHKPRPPRHKNQLPFMQLGPALQSELKKLHHVATRGSVVAKAEWDNVCKSCKQRKLNVATWQQDL